MSKMSNLKIGTKFLLIIGLFGVMSIASAFFAASKMKYIDQGYSNAIDQQGKTALYAARANRALYGIQLAIADLVLSETDAGNRAALDKMDKHHSALLGFFDKVKKADPSQIQTFDAL